MQLEVPFDLIVTIVNRGHSERVIDAARAAGAEGGTIIPGRGTGVHEKLRLWGIPIEPEKEIILTIVPQKITREVFESIQDRGNLNKPGTGIVFILDLKAVAGISHIVS